MKKINTQKMMSFLLFAMLTMVAISCKKESLSKTALLTKAPWKQTNVILPDGTDFTTDCIKDNIYTFKTDGTLLIDVGTNICNAGTNDAEEDFTETWLLTQDESFFTIDGEVFEIVTLDANNLTLKDENGTVKFKH